MARLWGLVVHGGHQHWVNGGEDLEVKLKDYLDGATVLFDAAGNVVDGRLQGGYISLRGLPGATLISQIFPSCGSCQVLVHYSAARAKSPSHRQAGMFPANGEERSSPLYLLKGINGQD